MAQSAYGDVREAVTSFLLDMKLRVAEGKWTLVDREKNLQDLAHMGMLTSDIPQVLQSLSPEDYCQGPLDDDRGRPLEWWVFGPMYLGQTLYVKLCINQKNWILCLSFHRNEHPLSYPLKEGRQA